MRIWLALIAAPLLALTDQLVASSLVSWACSRQSVTVLHASHALFLALAAATAAVSAVYWRNTRRGAASRSDAIRQFHFLAGLSTAVGSLATIAIAAMWIPVWLISPCIA
ncbi:MAG TPA: hypothetical protein VIE43_11480 [Thermoanaerobaculia bacterium]|jgi:hypothetical protein|nr:hypothetical protein [Thermoanaerobaculia bacterium]